ncbi:MAG: HAMP domain-containing histidine kinase [Myxococcales bacterium]|nr:HAMP domain-containing histidine kinase [Myxococcales bacterium]
MRIGTLRAAALVVGVALVAMIVLRLRRDDNPADQMRFARALRRSLELDARLNEEIAKSRLGVVTHYDALVAVGDKMTDVSRQLAVIPAFIDGHARSDVKAQLSSYRSARDTKGQLVETFKTAHSVLRNSVRAFPHNLQRVLAAARKLRQTEPLARKLTRLERAVTLLVVGSTRARVREARCALAAVGVKAKTKEKPQAGCTVAKLETPSAIARQLAIALSHARLIVELQPRIDSIVRRIVTLSVAKPAMAALDISEMSHRRALASGRTQRLVIFALALVLTVLTAAYIIGRLRRTASALREATARLETALAELGIERDRAKDLAELRSKFVSMASHEFRTPLARILSSAESLHSGNGKRPQAVRDKHMGRVKDAVKEMTQMLEDVLLIGHAETGLLELKPQQLALREVCDGIVEATRNLVGEERQLDYDVSVNGASVWLDEKLLNRVLSNLLINAFKYSGDDTSVRFAVQADEGAVLFTVSDQGLGIPPEDLPHLFEAFHRGSNTGMIPGTGLGLAVVKRSLDVHGGTIDVESQLGRGTTFTVRVPFVPQEEVEA